MNLFDLIPEKLFNEMVDAKYVNVRTHPQFLSLRIANYSSAAQFDGKWNEVTEQCRGLIYDLSTGKVVARPFRKFFNYGQPECPAIDMDAPAVVMDKMDGSLGILYKTPVGGYAIATRGSFNSDQAIHATKILNEKYGKWLLDHRELLEQYTPLFEIIYPENRIVCDYGSLNDLVLLDMVEIETGDSWGALTAQITLEWPGWVAEEFEYETMTEALAAPPRQGAEGFVVLFPDTGERVKIKQEDYINLHRIITGLNARTVWEHAKANKPLTELIENLPDEFHEWVKEAWNDLIAKQNNFYDDLYTDYQKFYQSTLSDMGGADSRSPEFRKQFALAIKDHPYKGFLFQYHDDKLSCDKVWDLFKPDGNVTPSGRTFTEDDK